MIDEFKNKNVIVTGAGSGIGQATALAFAEQGANVVLVDINAQGNAETNALLSKFSVKTVQVDCDLTREDQVEALMKTAVSELGGIHIAVNNAGVEHAMTNLVDQTVEAYDFVFDVNVKSLWLCMKHELGYMQEKGQGVIVNTSAMADSIGSPGLQFYVASKHAVLGLTRSVALEAIGNGVRINAVAPGPVKTRMVEDHFDKHPEHLDVVLQSVPAGRIGRIKALFERIAKYRVSASHPFGVILWGCWLVGVVCPRRSWFQVSGLSVCGGGHRFNGRIDRGLNQA